MKFLVVVLLLLSPLVSAQTCVDVDVNGYVHTTTDQSCPALLLSSEEFLELNKAHALVELEFDPDLFDIGLEAVIKFFIGGFFIGVILGYLNRLKR